MSSILRNIFDCYYNLLFRMIIEIMSNDENGAASRNRTGTGVNFPRDFKSLASTCSAIAALL